MRDLDHKFTLTKEILDISDGCYQAYYSAGLLAGDYCFTQICPIAQAIEAVLHEVVSVVPGTNKPGKVYYGRTECEERAWLLPNFVNDWITEFDLIHTVCGYKKAIEWADAHLISFHLLDQEDDMNTLNLEDLAAGLENLATNKSWTYLTSIRTGALALLRKAEREGVARPPMPCGAVGCALGHAPFIHGVDRFPTDMIVDRVKIREFYGITYEQEEAIFFTNTDGSMVSYADADLVSRGEVAARILFLIDNPEASTKEILAAGEKES